MSGHDPHAGHAGRLWRYVLSGCVLAFLVLPTLIVVPMSFSASQYLEFPPQHWSLRWYAAYAGSAEWRRATATSLNAAGLTVLVATPLGTLAAYGLIAAGVRRARAVPALLLAPLVVPVILVGIGVFYVYVRLGLVNTLAGLVAAHSMLALPLVFLVAKSALEGFDLTQETVARSLGATRLRAFLLVTLPQIRFAIATAGVLAFLTSFDEVVVAMFVSGGDNATLTRAMFDALRDQIDPTIAAISTVMVAVSSLLVLLVQALGRARR